MAPPGRTFLICKTIRTQWRGHSHHCGAPPWHLHHLPDDHGTAGRKKTSSWASAKNSTVDERPMVVFCCLWSVMNLFNGYLSMVNNSVLLIVMVNNGLSWFFMCSGWLIMANNNGPNNYLRRTDWSIGTGHHPFQPIMPRSDHFQTFQPNPDPNNILPMGDCTKRPVFRVAWHQSTSVDDLIIAPGGCKLARRQRGKEEPCQARN